MKKILITVPDGILIMVGDTVDTSQPDRIQFDNTIIFEIERYEIKDVEEVPPYDVPGQLIYSDGKLIANPNYYEIEEPERKIQRIDIENKELRKELNTMKNAFDEVILDILPALIGGV